MTNRENGAASATSSSLTWRRRKVWGSVGMTHYAETVIGENTYRFTVDQPKQHQWVARGWVNGSFFLYRDGGTLAAMKAEVLAAVAEAHDKSKGCAK